MDDRIKEFAHRAGGRIYFEGLRNDPIQQREIVELWDDRIEKFAKLVEADARKRLLDDIINLLEMQQTTSTWSNLQG